MLSCVIGNKDINAVDYKEEEIRQWSDRGILKCPICGETMIYRHGMLKIPHFAHVKDTECTHTFYENETKEHVQGKIILYNWIKNQSNIENYKLEAWIPETKQRPDLYFEDVDKNRYVIEFQCAPITVGEYFERHKLYEIAGIQDIWILGVEQYDMNNYLYKQGVRDWILKYKTNALERELYENPHIYYLNVLSSKIYIIRYSDVSNIGKYKTYFEIETFYLNDINTTFLNQDMIFNSTMMNDGFKTILKKRIDRAEQSLKYKKYSEDYKYIYDIQREFWVRWEKTI